MKPKLTLIGAGPGDPELITIKGMKALSGADVVLFDSLVSKDLLDFAPVKAIRVFVGKKAGTQKNSQNDINRMIVDYALNYGHVVRLKGGDPFIFGRGHEEIQYAEAFGIETKVIPGISSATGITSHQKIPLTKRGMNESFWVITGTTSSGKVSKDVSLAAQSTATVVILMGVNKLKEIAKTFIRYGKGETPAAIIQNGTLKNEKIIIGTVDTITEKAKDEGIMSPGVILIGDVISLHPNFNYQLVETNYSPKTKNNMNSFQTNGKTR